MINKNNKQIVIVDDSEHARKAVELYALAKGWIFYESDGTTVPDKAPDIPTIVLLDYHLGNASAEHWLELFDQAYPNCLHKVYLLTGDKDDGPKQLINKKPGLTLLSKPYDLALLDSLFPEPASAENQSLSGESIVNAGPSQHDDVCDAVEKLPVSVRLLDKKTFEPLYQNPTAANFAYDSDARLAVQALIGGLRNSGKKWNDDSVWEPQAKAWHRRRLYDVGSWYWLIEEELAAQPPSGDPYLPSLFRSGAMDDKLFHLADILSRYWGITRLRFYRVAKLYVSKLIANEAKPEQEARYVLQPIWQRGDGFSADGENWKKTEFLLEEYEGAEQVFLSPEKNTGLFDVDDKKPKTKRGCEAMRWGNAENCAEFALWEDKDGHTYPTGLLVFDRRSDHIDNAGMDILRVKELGSRIEQQELDSMNGFLEEIKPMLLSVIYDIRNEREHHWDEILRKITRKTVETDNSSETLQFAFEQIKADWDTQSGKLRDAYLIRVHSRGYLEPWVGTGPLAKAHGREVFDFNGLITQNRKEPHVIHDFDRDNCRQLEKLLPRDRLEAADISNLKSWLSIPLWHGQRNFAILVFAAEKANYFTTHRVKRLRDTALALIPLLLWAEAQAQRDWLRGSLTHEFQEPINHLQRLSKTLNNKHLTALLRVQSALIDNLRYFGEAVSADSSGKLTAVGSVLTEVADTIRNYCRPQREINIAMESFEPPPSFFDKLFKLSAIKPDAIPESWQTDMPREALFQVLFNLVENASKYTVRDQPIDIGIRLSDNAKVLLSIKNKVERPIPFAERESIFLPYRRASNVANAKGTGIGLAVVRQLANAFNAECKLENAGEAPEHEVCFTLSLPLAPLVGEGYDRD